MTSSATVVVVAYNDAPTLEACVHSLDAVVDAPIVIVDNHSDDNTWEVANRIASELSGVTAVRAEHNGGYAAGGNLGRQQADSPYLAITNADCVFTGDWVTPIVAYLEDHPDAVAGSPTLALASGELLNAEGLEIHKAGFGFNRHLGHPLDDAATAVQAVPGIQGTAFVVRTAQLDEIGGWYEGGFLYHEDVELSWALRLAGHEIVHVPTPPVEHDYELTMSPEKFFLLERNRLEMVDSSLGFWTRLLLSPVLIATELAVWLYALRKGSALMGAKWRSYQDFRQRREIRNARREQVNGFRRVSDWRLLGAMQWRYPRSQTGTLHRGDPTTGRRGGRDMPTG